VSADTPIDGKRRLPEGSGAKFGLKEEIAAIDPVRAAFETKQRSDRNLEQNSPAAVII
jgi:hypothetical protein